MVKRIDLKINFLFSLIESMCFSGLANRGLGSLELAQDEKVDEAVKMQALHEGNQFYLECNVNSMLFPIKNISKYFHS